MFFIILTRGSSVFGGCIYNLDSFVWVIPSWCFLYAGVKRTAYNIQNIINIYFVYLLVWIINENSTVYISVCIRQVLNRAELLVARIPFTKDNGFNQGYSNIVIEIRADDTASGAAVECDIC
jgi:hypothetical protein